MLEAAGVTIYAPFSRSRAERGAVLGGPHGNAAEQAFASYGRWSIGVASPAQPSPPGHYRRSRCLASTQPVARNRDTANTTSTSRTVST